MHRYYYQTELKQCQKELLWHEQHCVSTKFTFLPLITIKISFRFKKTTFEVNSIIIKL